MKKLKYLSILLILSVVGALLSSCRKDLCYDHNHAANVEVKISYDHSWRTYWDPAYEIAEEWEMEWDKILPVDAEGVRLVTYPHYSALSGMTYNLAQYGNKIQMSGGHHTMLFYNNDTEYLHFSGSGNVTTATASTRTRASYSKLYPDEITVNSPDMLYSGYLDDIFIEYARENEKPEPMILDVQLTPRVFTYVIRQEFVSGLEYVKQARGALSGMSATVMLATGETTNEPVTLLYDCVKKNYGCETIIRSFGVPAIRFDSKMQEENEGTKAGEYLFYRDDETTKNIILDQVYPHKLILELYLINGKQKNIEIDVTEQVNKQPRGGVIVVKGLIVTEEEAQEPDGPGGDGGFDTSIDGWEDDIIVDVPII